MDQPPAVPTDEPPAVAFTAFADVWPRAIETELGATPCAIGARRTSTLALTFFCNKEIEITNYRQEEQ